MCRGLEHLVKVVPPINYISSPPKDVLEATSKVIPDKQAPFVVRIVEEKLVQGSVNKDNNPALKEPEAALDFGVQRGPIFLSLQLK
ncbi:hypothetical protein ACOSQ2_006991 [Xanthoceras sorbifolium]